MNKENKIFLLSNIVLTGFFIAIIFHYFCETLGNLYQPFNNFLLSQDYPKWVFGDFIISVNIIKDLNPYGVPNPVIVYFPLAFIVLFPLTLIKNVLVGYSIFLIFFLSFLDSYKCKTFYLR